MLRDEITMDDLQEQHREYAEIIGIDNLMALAEHFGGSSIYIPKVDDILRQKRYKAIFEEYDGSRECIHKLCIKYDVSESTVYRIIQDKLSRGSGKVMEGQMTFADCFGNL